MNKEVLGGLYKGLAYRIQINRPDKLNAINKAMWASLKGELENEIGRASCRERV